MSYPLGSFVLSHYSYYSFLSWFIGFFEAVGSFLIRKRGSLQFVITLGYRNLFVLYFIQSRLNLGRVLKHCSQSFRFVIHDFDGLLFILNLFNGNLILSSSRFKFFSFVHSFCSYFNYSFHISFSPSFFSLSHSWFAGFVDGFGSFSILFFPTVNQFLIRFLISFHEDLSFLSFFFPGCLSYNSSNHLYSFVVSDWSSSKKRPLNIFSVISYFRSHPLLTSKANCYSLWFYIQNQFFYTALSSHKLANLKVLSKFINSF